MPRQARIVVPNTPHHVMQQSVKGVKVFRKKEDYKAYLEKLVDIAGDYKVEILGYCLTTSKVHLILQPKDADSLGKVVRQVHSFYSRYYNEKYNVAGSIWGDRFASCPVEKAKLDEVCRYVERAFIAGSSKRKVEAYEHNSAADHISKTASDIVSDKFPAAKDKKKWSKFINTTPDKEEIESIEHCTRRGYAYGSKAFITRLEKKLGRKVAPIRGRE